MGMIMASPIHSDIANRARQAYEEMRDTEQQQRIQQKIKQIEVEQDEKAANTAAAIASGNGRAQLVTSLSPAVEERIAYELRQIAHLRALWWRRDTTQLDEREKKLTLELRRHDSEVKQHEQAHVSTGGALIVSGPYYKFVTGPDGRNYAIGGQVSLDITPEKDPQKTIKKAEQIERTAMAPLRPSPQDYQVVNQAKQLELIAEQQIAINFENQKNKIQLKNNQHNIEAFLEKKQTKFDDSTDTNKTIEPIPISEAQEDNNLFTLSLSANINESTQATPEGAGPLNMETLMKETARLEKLSQENKDQEDELFDDQKKQQKDHRHRLYLDANFNNDEHSKEEMMTTNSINLFI